MDCATIKSRYKTGHFEDFAFMNYPTLDIDGSKI